MVNAIHYLHVQKKLLHRNIESNGMVLTANQDIKLTDLSSCHTIYQRRYAHVGNPKMFAPELMITNPYSIETDVYALGVFLYELVTRKEPYASMDITTLYAFIGKGSRALIPEGTPKLFEHLITQCWAQRPIDRPTTQSILEQLEHPNCIINEDCILGEGTYGRVYLGFYYTGLVAIKKIPRIANTMLDIEAEKDTLSQINHPHIIKLIHSFKTSRYEHLVLEYCPDGNLASLLRDPEVTLEIIPIFQQIVDALHYLHTIKHLLHRDLKTENMMLKGQCIKLIDFGFALPIETPSYERLGSLKALAAEILARRSIHYQAFPYSTATDIYALGIVLLELELRNKVYDYPLSERQLVKAITSGKRPPIPQTTPPAIKPMIRACWAQEPTNRPTTTQLKQYIETQQKKGVIASSASHLLWHKPSAADNSRNNNRQESNAVILPKIHSTPSRLA